MSEVTGREGLCHQSNPSPSPVEELGYLKVLKISKVPLGLQKQVGRPELSLPELADSLPPRPMWRLTLAQVQHVILRSVSFRRPLHSQRRVGGCLAWGDLCSPTAGTPGSSEWPGGLSLSLALPRGRAVHTLPTHRQAHSWPHRVLGTLRTQRPKTSMTWHWPQLGRPASLQTQGHRPGRK